MSKFSEFLKKVIQKVTDLIAKILPSSKHLLDVALDVCDAIKKAIDSGAVDMVTALIPGTLDDVIADKVKQYLPVIMVDLKLARDEADKTPEQILKDALESLRTMSDNARATTLQSIWKLLSDYLTEEAITFKDLQTMAQPYYEQYGKYVNQLSRTAVSSGTAY